MFNQLDCLYSHNNLYKHKVFGTYYRLFGHSITPNGCWITGAFYRELKDIDAATGNDIYGEDVVPMGDGTVQSGPAFIRATPDQLQDAFINRFELTVPRTRRHICDDDCRSNGCSNSSHRRHSRRRYV